MRSGRSWGRLGMTFNFDEIHKIFEELKETKDFKEYLDEIETNNKILSSHPFALEDALKQIDKLTGKYRAELNILAQISNNGMYVSNQVVYQTPDRIFNDLNYINGLIPLFALERKAITRACSH